LSQTSHSLAIRAVLLFYNMRFQTLCSLLSLVGTAFSTPLAYSSTIARQAVPVNSPSTVHGIWNFPNGTWVENLAVRSNGQILVTLLNTPRIYQVDPTLKHPAALVHTFSSYLGCLGIAELQPDVFYVVTSNFSTLTLQTAPGSFSVWKVNMTGFLPGCTSPAASKVADFPQSSLFNGMTALDPSSGILLIADSGAGAVWSLDVNTGAKSKAITDTLMAPTSTGFGLGINGLKVRNGDLYFTNTNQALFASAPVNAVGAEEAQATALTSNLAGLDDFQFDSQGNALFAGNGQLRYRAAAGDPLVVVSNSTLLAGSTAVGFGRLPADRNSVYVTTNGGVGQYVSRDYATPGRVVRVDVAGMGY